MYAAVWDDIVMTSVCFLWFALGIGSSRERHNQWLWDLLDKEGKEDVVKKTYAL